MKNAVRWGQKVGNFQERDGPDGVAVTGAVELRNVLVGEMERQTPRAYGFGNAQISAGGDSPGDVHHRGGAAEEIAGEIARLPQTCFDAATDIPCAYIGL